MSSRIRLATTVGLLLLGLPLLAGGGHLVLLDGTFYYLTAGALLIISGVLAWRRDRLTIWLYLLLTGGTMVWAVMEVGFDCWALLPRISLFACLGLWFVLPPVNKYFDRGIAFFGSADVTVAGMACLVLFLAVPVLCVVSYVGQTFTPVQPQVEQKVDVQVPRNNDEWLSYGNTERGDRFSSADQINPDNVKNMELAWRYRTRVREQFNVPGKKSLSFQATPIKVGDNLYFCTPYSMAISLDADTGEERWRFNPEVSEGYAPVPCRGVSYYTGSGTNDFCDQRILMAATDNRLHALDLKTGEHCPDFGSDGIVDLTVGMGKNPPLYQYTTSAPTVIGDTVVLGGGHMDNQSNDEPPGVIRAFNARSGQLLWAWEVLEPKSRKSLAKNGSYVRNTPNAWSVFSADSTLGLVYIPTGNTPPDYFGGLRTPAQDRYSSSIVALDVATGNVSWHFQTVHHDIWDLDIASQPVLADIDTPQGKRAALIAPTKRGDIFVLDRRTGEPLLPIQEKPVPQGTVDGEWLSLTQPYQPDFPSFAPPDLHEADMWGATLFDQMLCRIKFRQYRYEGQFTPPSLQGTISYPANFGVINWGSVAVDPERQIMIVNSSWLPFINTLIPREEADALGIKPMGSESTELSQHGSAAAKIPWAQAQAGTPYAVKAPAFLSPLGFPCHQPPWGIIAGVDLKTNNVLWQQPFGTSRDAAPLGLPLPLGVFSQGGAVVTRSGLAFIGAAIDNFIRAYSVETGEELWKARIPAGGQATPMTYVSKRTGRQYVVIAAGGHSSLQTTQGDYLMAYTLPREASPHE